MRTILFALLITTCCMTCVAAEDAVPEFKWRAVEIDKIEIGYGVQLTDVNGDGKTDIVLADKKTFQWYENPSWKKHIIAKDLTVRDNVCITARDIDGDGKCEIAVGGQWNYRESNKDGAVFYLSPPEDRTQPWTAKQLHNDPSTHRMHWVKGPGDDYRLIVKPLRGRGSVDGDGPGLRVLEYIMPENPQDEWTFAVVCDFLHLSHNFHPVNWDDDPEEELIIAAKEGVWHFDRQSDKPGDWKATQLTDQFAGEIRDGKLPNGKRFIATVEPKHGSVCAVYVEPDKPGELWPSLKVLDEQLKDGHALAVADYLNVGSDQIVVGWRAMNDPGVPGIKLFTPLDKDGTQWRETRLSADEVAVEDIKAADLNGDGKVDIVAAARQTKNLTIFWNETPTHEDNRPKADAGVFWPGWLGSKRNGWVDHFQPPTVWPKSLSKVWQVEVGTGYGSALVAGDRVYQHAREGEKEVLWCFDLASGKEIWKQSHSVPFKAAPGGEWHGNGPKSSPLLADGRVFTMSILGDISAWDATSGDLLWRSDYGKRFKQNHPNWGVSTSPAIDGGNVVAHFGNDDEGALIALDAATGEEAWTQGKDGASYSSPLAVEIHGVRQIVDWNHRAIVGVESETGKALWEFPFPHLTHNQNMPTPTFHEGRILLGGENRGIHCLEPQVTDGKWSVKDHWFQKDVALDMSTAVINGDLLFGFSHYKKGQLFCLNTESGEVLWQGPGRLGQNVAFLSIPDHVVALLDSGRVQVIKASGGTLEEVANYQVADNPTWAPPVLLQDGLLVKDQDGLTLWSFK